MATTPQQGIMALPEGGQEQQAPQLGLDDSYDAIRGGLSEASPEASAQVQDQLNAILPALDQLTDEQLDSLVEIVQYMHDHEEEYPQLVAELVRQDIVDEGVFPDEYDPEVIATLGMVLLEAKRQRRASAPQMPQPPMGMARGGIAEAARMVARSGRGGDTMLAHINPEEAALLKRHGGSGTINPVTGLREYKKFYQKAASVVSGAVKGVTGAVKGVVNGVVNTVKDFAKSTVGKILITAALATFLGPGAFGVAGMGFGAGASLGLASAGASILGGGNFKDALQAGAKGYFLGSVGAAAGAPLGAATGVTSAAGQAALGAGAAGAGLGLLTGQSLKDSVKSGLTAATIAGLSTGAAKGFDTPAQAGAVTVDPKTGQVSTGGAEVVDSVAPKTPDQIQAEMAQQGNLSLAAQQPPVAPPVAQNAPVAPPMAQNAPPMAQNAPMGADPLGDFITQNDALRSAANTPVPNAQPSFMDSVSDFYDKNISPSGRAASGLADAKASALSSYKADIAAGVPESVAAEGYRAALKAATPGVLSTYGPMVGAGLGAAALLGGFESKPVQASPGAMNIASGQATRDLMAANPKDYLVQNLPGVQYDAKGNIIGSTPWTPRKAMQTEVGSDSYIPFTLPTYNAPTNSIGSRQVQQPYNTADMYTNLMPPRYAAQGGMMDTQGAFPANPLSMQSSPMMGMEAHQLPMNTSGVPMNMPMGLAEGGIASMPPPHFAFGGIADMVKRAAAAVPASAPAATPIAVPTDPAAAYGAAPASAPAPTAGVAPVATAAPTDPDAARAYASQKAANERLAAYRARQLAVQQAMAAANPAMAAGQATGNMLNPSLSNADFRARLMAGVQRPAGAMAVGGIASLAPGGYPRRTGQISGPGTETSDDIPAMLSDGEFVMTAKAVKGIGGGSRRAGAKKMYALMHRLEKNAARG